MYNNIWHLSKNEIPGTDNNRIIITYTENKKNNMEPDYKKLYEEEHKKYEETLSRAKGLIDGMKEENVDATKDDIKNLFPGEELEENENERIRKNCIHFLELQKKHHAATFEIEECITWLTSLKDLAFPEKQDEQKSTDTPKFRVGDWIVQKNVGVFKIIEVCKSWYEVIDSEDNYRYSISFDYEHLCHLWTIQDAKDGDILAWDDSNCIAVFSKIENDDSFISHGFIGNITGVFEKGYGGHSITHHLHPASKEQRDILFQKMKEAGYEWDGKNKVLKKIEKSDSAWSEEDETLMNGSISYLCNLRDSFKGEYDKEAVQTCIYWIKSLLSRFNSVIRWKPTEEQMKVLENAAREAEYNQRFKEADALWSLDEDLKKL